MHFPKLNYKATLIVSACLLAFGIGFGFFAFPKLLKKMVTGQINVAPGSTIRPLYEKAPFFIDFRVRLFNVTNKEEIIEGKKPKLQEIGPYFFEEWKEKFEMVDDDAEDTVTYHYRNKFIFRPDLSDGLTGDEIITMPHPLIMGMLMAVNVDKQAMLPTIEGVLKNLFHDPADAFYTGRVMDLLFDGVGVDCSSDDKTTIAICMSFDSNKALRKIDDQHYAFSLFGGTNYTDLGEFKVYRGKKNYRDLGRVISFNGETEMNAWDEDECNTYVGTDSTIFPAFMSKEEGIWAYEPSICRSLGASYRSKSKYNGLPVLVYEMDMGEDINIKQCFCRDEDNCPPKGTIDLFKCGGVPMIASLPHFYLADPKLLEGIDSGLNPTKEKHGISMLFEIMTGSPLKAAKRLQFSLEVKSIPQVEMVKNVPDVIFPLFWVEEGVSLGREFTDKMKNSLFLMIKIVKVVKWLCIVIGALGGILSGVMMVMSSQSNNKVTMPNGR
ncbi:sensory neuron membrane protein 1-like [Sitodiplosis mosellana]|uniref:sensory neuron membrane protein 1-like n=1 Tax=Sitodiplosis mosellana TaxID=263140 RepID=UPI002443BD18|nr:sensory neuron membrane protein 1-like [Sitodiplosis mosellana]